LSCLGTKGKWRESVSYRWSIIKLLAITTTVTITILVPPGRKDPGG